MVCQALCPWDSPGKNTAVGCQFLLQGIFLTQESNLGLPHCRQIFFYHLSHHKHIHIWVPQVALVVKNLPASAGELRDAGPIPGLGRIPGRGQASHSSILAWKTPWTKEPGELQSIGLQRVGHDWSNLAHACIYVCECVCVQLLQLCLNLCDPMDRSPPTPLSMGFSQQEHWSAFHAHLQGIFLTQGSNVHLLHCRQILYHWATEEVHKYI